MKTKQRILSVIVALAMCVSCLPYQALAVDTSVTAANSGDLVCICTEKCTDGNVNQGCPVCGAEGVGLSACKGTETETTGKQNEPTVETMALSEAAQSFVDGVNAIDKAALLALAQTYADDKNDAAYAALDAVYQPVLDLADSYTALTEDDQKNETVQAAYALLQETISSVDKVLYAEMGGSSNNLAVEGGTTVDVSQSSLYLRGDNAQNEYSLNGGSSWTVYTGALTVTGTTTANTVTVQSGTHNIVLQDAKIDVSARPNTCAFEMQGTSIVDLTLKGRNVLKSGEGKAGLLCPVNTKLSIGGNGALEAAGTTDNAAIGGNKNNDENVTGKNGEIIINGGNITAIGGKYAAGIGTGNTAVGKSITINGGTLQGSMIGAGNNSYVESVTVTGGNIAAKISDNKAPVNGSNTPVYCIELTLYGAVNEKVTSITGVNDYGLTDVYTTADGRLVLYLPENTSITKVNTDKGEYSRPAIVVTADGNAKATLHPSSQKTVIDPKIDLSQNGVMVQEEINTKYFSVDGGKSWDIYTGTMTVTGATTVNTVTVQSGTHNIVLENADIDVSTVENACAFEMQGTSIVDLTLKGRNVLKSGNGKAGLLCPVNARLSIGGSGALEAAGTINNAAIGGGANGEITINGGNITAIGGQYAAGIGTGNRAAGKNITIKGGTMQGSPIGGGHEGYVESVTVTGGNIAAKIGNNKAPVNGSNTPVYCIELTLHGAANEKVTSIEGVTGYGLDEVYTTAEGKLVLYLPENTSITKVTTSIETYSCPAIVVTADGNAWATLHPSSQKTVTNPEIDLSQNGVMVRQERGIKYFTINGGRSWDIYTGTMTLTGATNANTVTVQSGTHNIVLRDASIDVRNVDGSCAFEMQGTSIVDLTLKGKNALKSGNTKPALLCPVKTKLTINGNGTLEAAVSKWDPRDWSVIGNAEGGLSGNITVNGGHITADCGERTAGIGSGRTYDGKSITINGGTFQGSSPIGGSGSTGAVESVTINGGNISNNITGAKKLVNGSNMPVYRVDLTLSGAANEKVTSIAGVDYGLTDVYTTVQGHLVMYLPEGTEISKVTTDKGIYTCESSPVVVNKDGGAAATFRKTLTVDDFTFTPPSNTVYTGRNIPADIHPNAGVSCGRVTVKYYGSNGEPMNSAPVNVGDYTVKIDVETGGNYYAASDLTAASWKFSITPAKVAVPAAKSNLIFDNNVQTGVAATSDLYTVTNGTGKDAGNYTAVLQLKDKNNYVWDMTMPTTEDQQVPWSIAKLDISTGSGVGGFKQMTYTGSAQIPEAVVIKNGITVTGAWSAVTNVTDRTTFTASGNFIGSIPNARTGMAQKTVDALDLSSIVAAPVKAAKPQSSIDHTQYTGTIVWNENPSVFFGGKVYTANITLDATANYKFDGIKKDSFTHTGAGNVSNGINSGSVTIVFLATETRAVSAVNVTGTPNKTEYYEGETFDPAGLTITAVYDDTTTENVTAGYSVTPNVLTADTQYVTIDFGGKRSELIAVKVREKHTLTANDFTFTPPAKNVYTGSAITAEVIPNAGISCGNVIVKYYDSKGEPMESAPVNAGDYTVKIDAEGSVSCNAASHLTDASWTFRIIPAKVAVPAPQKDLTFNGQEQTGLAETNLYTVTSGKGTNAGTYTAVVQLRNKNNYVWDVKTPASDDQSVSWSIAKLDISTGANVGSFAAMTYTGEAQTPAADVTKNDLPVTGTWSDVTNVADKTTFTASGNFTGRIADQSTGMAKKTVDALELRGIVTAPVKAEKPQTSISAAQYTGSIEWSDTPSVFFGGKVYTATVTLTAAENYTFEGVKENDFTYKGATSVSNSAGSGTVTIVFPATDARAVAEVKVTGKLNKTDYIVGESFDPAGLTITAVYDDTTTEEITTATEGCSVTPGVMAANTTSVTIDFGGKSSALISVTVRENLKAIENPASKTDLVNGTAKNAKALGLPETVEIATDKGTDGLTAPVIWDVESSSYDPDKTAAQTFTVNGKVTLPEGMSNTNGVALTSSISVSVKAAETVTPAPQDTTPGTTDTAETVTGLTKGQTVINGMTMTITAKEFVRGDKTYIPLTWSIDATAESTTEPPAKLSGDFVKTDDKIYTATAPTKGMTNGRYTFTITYREVSTTDSIATGNVVNTVIHYTLQTPSLTRPTYPPTVEKAENGSVTTSPSRPEKGDDVTIQPKPAEGFEVDKIIVTDQNGKPVAVTRKPDGTWTYEQPSGKVNIKVTFKPAGTPWENPFTDVGEGAWYEDAIRYVYECGLMAGTSATTFEPNTTTSRGMIVTILYRLAGSPALEDTAWGYPYADVDADAYYSTAIYWARMHGIVSGYSDELFGPNDTITREQLAAILYRFAQHQGYNTTLRADLSGYADADKISAWALEAVRWANAEGLITGTSKTTLTPCGSATRAQVAAILMRFCERYTGNAK